MTNAEAIEILKHLRDDLHLQSKEYIDCFDMAISALEKQEQKKPLTNADRIRAMTDEQLDHFLGDVQWDVANCCGGVTEKQEYPVPEKKGCWLDYLKQEVKDNA